jgi:hypothetical protein
MGQPPNAVEVGDPPRSHEANPETLVCHWRGIMARRRPALHGGANRAEDEPVPPFRRMLALAPAAGALVILVACGDKGLNRIPPAASLSLGPPPTAPTSVYGGVAPPQLGPAPTNAGAPETVGGTFETGPHAVGERVMTATGNAVTLQAYIPSVSGASTTAANSTLATADIEICANSPAQVSPDLFRLELASGTLVAPSPNSGQEPALPTKALTAGACVRGWVGFELPSDSPASTLVFRGSSVVRWSLV